MEVVLFLLSVVPVVGKPIAAGGVDGTVKSSHAPSSHHRRIPELR